jgi:hypothetical protein
MTLKVQQLFDQGQRSFPNGIHLLVGDPAPGVPKVAKAWYQPDESFRDGEVVTFKAQQPHQIVRATYGPEGSSNDVTQQVRNLISQGQTQVHGGIHTALGDPAPGAPKKFNIFYAGGSGIPPHKLQQLQQSFNTWDADRSGFLDKSEALAAFFSLLPHCSPVEIQQRITQADSNGDGLLSFDEYARIAVNFM